MELRISIMTNPNTNPDYCKDAEKTALVRLCGVLGVLTENNDLATAALLAATRIERLEKKIPALNVDLAEASMHAYNGEIARMKLEAELARRDASLLTEGEQKEILSYIRGNYDRDKIPCWLLDLIDGVARRDEIIKRLKEDGERLADNYIAAKRMICACFVADYQDDEIITLHRALMNELEEG
jgi:type I site-specific restriction-modification system R (restriction) subunit